MKLECVAKELFGFGRRTELDIKIDDVLCTRVEVLPVPDDVQPVQLLVGRSWTEEDHIAYLRLGDELRVGYKDELPFFYIELQYEETRDGLRVHQTVTVPSQSISWVTVETKHIREADVAVPLGNGKGHVVHLREGRTVLPVVNDTEREMTIRRETLLVHGDVLSEDSEVQEEALVQTGQPIDRSTVRIGDASEAQTTELTTLIQE